jgi:hypothetical protein
MQQPGQQASEDQQEHRDNGGGGQHLAQDPALDCLRHGRGCLQERHQRDLRTDPDQQQQERIDDECSVQRFEVLHRAPSSMVGGPYRAIDNPRCAGNV